MPKIQNTKNWIQYLHHTDYETTVDNINMVFCIMFHFLFSCLDFYDILVIAREIQILIHFHSFDIVGPASQCTSNVLYFPAHIICYIDKIEVLVGKNIVSKVDAKLIAI